MIRPTQALIAGCLLACIGCEDRQANTDPPQMNTNFTEELQILTRTSVYFGHQSVGDNIVEGIRDLVCANPSIALNLVHLSQATPLPPVYFAETHVGENGDPASKCNAFKADILGHLIPRPKLAAMKYCFVDIRSESDLKGIFDVYCRTVDSLKAGAPDVRLVHVTVPLSARTVWWKLLLKRVLFKEDRNDMNNIRRNEFNTLLRERYHADPIFDLAMVESTAPDGKRVEFTAGGRTYNSLCSEYTYDGGHLNSLGRRSVAMAFLRDLAKFAREQGNP